MYPFHEIHQRQLPVRGKPEELTCLCCGPDGSRFLIEAPESGIGRLGRKAQTLLAEPKGDVLEFHLTFRQRGPKQPEAQLGAHDQSDKEKQRGDQDWELDKTPEHQHHLDGAHEDGEEETDRQHQRSLALSAAPGADTAVEEEQQRQQQARLANQHPGIGDTVRRDSNLLAEESEVINSGQLGIVEIRTRQEIRHQGDCSQSCSQPSHPGVSWPQAQVNQSQEGEKTRPDRDLEPA